jgi:hypothetical protein
MFIANALVLAADPGRGGQDPGTGLGFGLIAAVVVGILVLAAVGFWLAHHLTSNSKGGIRPRPDELRPGKPPFESIGRHRKR